MKSRRVSAVRCRNCCAAVSMASFAQKERKYCAQRETLHLDCAYLRITQFVVFGLQTPFSSQVRGLDPQANMGTVHCEKHPDTELVCPACAGEIGGRARANKLTWDQRREIARLGGLATRGRRKRRRKDRPNGDLQFPAPRRVRPIGDEW